MSAPKLVTANYDTQHKLTLATNPAAVGTSNIAGASDGDWFDAGSSVTVTATANVPTAAARAGTSPPGRATRAQPRSAPR